VTVGQELAERRRRDSSAGQATSSEQVTATVLDAIGGAAGTRAGDILAAVIRHAHDLAREVRLQPGELLAAADFLKRCGDISDPARHEFILLADVLGLTMVDTEAADVPDGALETSVLGPFYRAGAPWEETGRTSPAASMTGSRPASTGESSTPAAPR
jgi:hydroxyquinol 1,2-dioxygenase